MQHKVATWTLILVLILAGMASCGEPKVQETIKIGVIAPTTGSIPAVGRSTVDAARMAEKEINDAGGLDVGGKKLRVELFIEDDQDNKEIAVQVAQRLINQNSVVALIGPQASRNAIPVAAVAEAAHIPMISPWSTAEETTAGKAYIFRAAFIDSFQGRVMARFAFEELHADTAAVLYDVASDYNRGIAEIFKQVFENAGGRVVAFEHYTTGDQDFSTQLTAIKNSNAKVLFLPNYYNEIPLQVEQARALGIEAAMIGSDSWGSLEPAGRQLVEGAFYSTHYAPDIAGPVAESFIAAYQDTYDAVPDDVAALTYDAFGLLFEAIRTQGKTDPESIRNGLASIRRYEGVTGVMEYRGTGDPVKSAVILTIEQSEPRFYRLAEP